LKFVVIYVVGCILLAIDATQDGSTLILVLNLDQDGSTLILVLNLVAAILAFIAGYSAKKARRQIEVALKGRA